MKDLRYMLPRLLLPTFTWRHRILGSVELAAAIPPTPRLRSKLVRHICGFVHKYLQSFSRHYCGWIGIPFDNQVAQLPFGLVLKWSDGTRLEEVSATIVARSAGFPVPKIIAYGEHPDTPHAPVSILMTRVPGQDLGDPELYEKMSSIERETIFKELDCMLQVMRDWANPWGKNRICSILGTAVRSVRVSDHSFGPCESESEFNEHLFRDASGLTFVSKQEFEEKLAVAKLLQSLPHSIVFTHGDLKHHNIMVHDGHISGFIDWECAGWLPDLLGIYHTTPIWTDGLLVE